MQPNNTSAPVKLNNLTEMFRFIFCFLTKVSFQFDIPVIHDNCCG